MNYRIEKKLFTSNEDETSEITEVDGDLTTDSDDNKSDADQENNKKDSDSDVPLLEIE